MEGLTSLIQERLAPLGEKIGREKHLSAISTGILATVPLTIIGAIFTILANPPATEEILNSGNFLAPFLSAWLQWATANSAMINQPINMTTNLLGLVVSFSIAYNLSKSYAMNAMTSGILSFVTFLMVAAPIGEGGMDVSYLGASGIFVAILVSLLSVEFERFCYDRNLGISLGENVPPAVNDSFKAILPLVLDVAVLYGLNIVCQVTMGKVIPAVIMSVLTPAIDTVSSPLVIIAMLTLGLILWTIGIHGLAIISPIMFTLLYAAAGANADLIALIINLIATVPILSATRCAEYGNEPLVGRVGRPGREVRAWRGGGGRSSGRTAGWAGTRGTASRGCSTGASPAGRSRASSGEARRR